MASTASHIQNDQRWDRFYYLKITGLPYYFMCTINPASSRYGTFAWTLPTGYTAVQGMQVPDGNLEQRLSDIIGGIASAEQIRITLTDFDAFDAAGKFSYLTRLFSPGRLALDDTRSTLSQSIRVTDGAAATFTVSGAGAGVTLGATTPWVGHVGNEAIQIAAPVTSDSNGDATLTIAARNLYPCATSYPPIPYHFVLKDETGVAIPERSHPVTTEPYALLGRTAALYLGHVEPNGMPCLESETLCRVIGRITKMDYGNTGGEFEVTIESASGDMANGQVAPSLSIAQIKPDQLIVQGDYRYLTISAGLVDVNVNPVREMCEVMVAAGSYDIQSLANEINRQLVIGFPDLGVNTWIPRCGVHMMDGIPRVSFAAIEGFRTKDVYDIQIKNGPKNQLSVTRTVPIGLMSVLGFPDENFFQSKAGSSGDFDVIAGSSYVTQEIVCENPLPSVFIPFDLNGVTFNVTGDTSTFFTDQGDNASGAAYVRLPDGRLVELLATGTGTLTTGGTPAHPPFTPRKPGDNVQGGWGCFRADRGTSPTIEQVVVLPPDANTQVSAATIVGRLLASTGQQTGGYDTLPQGVGLGLNAILDSESILKLGDDGSPRASVIDSKTKFSDIFQPISREYGWFLVWNPGTSKYMIRPVRVPSAPRASDIPFNDSNRADADITGLSIDQTSLRSSWTLKWGWDRMQDKFIGNPITLMDPYVMSAYAGAPKGESIEDKTLAMGGGTNGFQIVLVMLEHSYLYRQPWMKGKRTFKMPGLLIAPGSAHLVVEAQTINPFTGKKGITAADRIYALVTGVSMNPSSGVGTVEYVINRQDPSSIFREVAPTGLLDYTATGHGYDNATGAIVFDSRYASDGTSKDGIDFAVGDSVTIFRRDADATAPYEVTTTIATLSSDGHTGTVAPGLGAPGAYQLVMVLRNYGNATAARKLATAFQGHVSGKIENTVKNHKWQ